VVEVAHNCTEVNQLEAAVEEWLAFQLCFFQSLLILLMLVLVVLAEIPIHTLVLLGKHP
jgi:hypothetical protein